MSLSFQQVHLSCHSIIVVFSFSLIQVALHFHYTIQVVLHFIKHNAFVCVHACCVRLCDLQIGLPHAPAIQSVVNVGQFKAARRWPFAVCTSTASNTLKSVYCSPQVISKELNEGLHQHALVNGRPKCKHTSWRQFRFSKICSDS